MSAVVPSPAVVPLRLLGVSSAGQLRSSFRSAEFAVGAMAVPVLLYAMFGLPRVGSLLPAGTPVTLAILVSMACYGRSEERRAARAWGGRGAACHARRR